MRKHLLVSTAALFLLGMATQANATTGRERFAIKLKDNFELEQLITTSLKADSTGNKPIMPSRCQANGDSCATPKMYLDNFRRADPVAAPGLKTVADLPSYVHRLILIDTPKDVSLWMACITPPKGGMPIQDKWHCLARTFHDLEKVYANPDTLKPVLAGDCGNPVGELDVKKIVEDCNEIDFWLNPRDETHIGYLSNEALPDDKCNALMKAGENEWGYLLQDECPRDRCDFSRPSREEGLPVQAKPRISFTAQTAGWYRLRVSRKAVGVWEFCVIWPDKYQSMAKPIKPQSFGSFGRAYLTYPQIPITHTFAYKGKESTMPPTDWRGVVHFWKDSGQRIMPE